MGAAGHRPGNLGGQGKDFLREACDCHSWSGTEQTLLGQATPVLGHVRLRLLELMPDHKRGQREPGGHLLVGLGRSTPQAQSLTLPSRPWAGGQALILPPLMLTQEHPVSEEHHSLEPHLGLHPAQRHVVCGPAHHEPRSPPEQRSKCQCGGEGLQPRALPAHPFLTPLSGAGLV